MYFTLVSSLDFCLISSLFFNFYCITAHVSPPKVRPVNGISTPIQQQQQQPISGQQLNDVQNIRSDWIKVVGPNGYPFRGNRLSYPSSQFSANSQLPPFPPPPPSPQQLSPSSLGLPGSYLLSSASQQSSPIFSSDKKDNPTDLKSPPVASSSLSSLSSSSSWSKVYPSSQSGSVIWPNQVKSST